MSALPIGSIVLFDGATPPAGWYDCDGSTQNGLVTPNLIGAFPRGVLASGGSLGATGGATTHSHTNSASGYTAHGHAASGSNSGVSSGTTVGNIWGGNTYTGVAGHQHFTSSPALSSQANHQHTIPGTDTATSMPPYIRLRYIIRCE